MINLIAVRRLQGRVCCLDSAHDGFRMSCCVACSAFIYTEYQWWMISAPHPWTARVPRGEGPAGSVGQDGEPATRTRRKQPRDHRGHGRHVVCTTLQSACSGARCCGRVPACWIVLSVTTPPPRRHDEPLPFVQTNAPACTTYGLQAPSADAVFVPSRLHTCIPRRGPPWPSWLTACFTPCVGVVKWPGPSRVAALRSVGCASPTLPDEAPSSLAAADGRCPPGGVACEHLLGILPEVLN